MDHVMQQRLGRRLALGLSVVWIVGCTKVGPDFKTPQTPVPDVWEETATAGLTDGKADLQTWWQTLRDPTLDSLVSRATTSNLDTRIMLSRIQAARFRLGIAKGLLIPDVRLGAQASYRKLSDNGAFEQIAPANGFDESGLYTVGADAAWEIDLFGRLRRTVEAAGATYQAQIEDYRDVLVTLLAEVGMSYVEVRMTQQRLAIANENAARQRETLALTRDRFEAGLTSELDVAQAESNLAGTLAQIPALDIDLAFALNRLAVLLAQDPGSLNDRVGQPGPIPQAPPVVGTGLPADLVRQRPDIRAAERVLAAQTAQVGAAKASLYPSLALTGAFAQVAREPSDLGNRESSTWSVDLPLTWTAFDGGELRNRVKVQGAQAEQALLHYEQTVLRALEEVENALTAYTREQTRRDRWSDAVVAAQRAVDLAHVQYESGLTDFQNVLDAERTLFAQQDQLALSDGQVIVNLIALYKSLGGGWSPEEFDNSGSLDKP